MSEKPSAFRRFADKVAVESEPGLSNTQMMVRNLARSSSRHGGGAARPSP
jgi:hypothetical protein